MTPEPLVVTTREPATPDDGVGRPFDPAQVENVHFGSIAIVDVDGRLAYRVGDPHWSTFTRSTLKPFQAVPFVRDGGPDALGWDSRRIALMCASHSGEPMHTDLVASMLASADCDAGALQCGCHVPGRYAALGEAPPSDAVWSPLEHNCSGKHAGFLAACRLRGEPVDDYCSPHAPLQRRVAAAIGELAGLDPHRLPWGTDGCSAPNAALPLSRLALLYARLARGAQDATDGASLGVLRDAMTSHPELVSGTARSDRALMSLVPGDLVTKIGADGVQAIGVRSLGVGIAIKITDGSRDALYCAVVAVLEQLGLLPREGVGDAFDPWLRPDVRNARGLRTGRLLSTFRLLAA